MTALSSYCLKKMMNIQLHIHKIYSYTLINNFSKYMSLDNCDFAVFLILPRSNRKPLIKPSRISFIGQ